MKEACTSIIKATRIGNKPRLPVSIPPKTPTPGYTQADRAHRVELIQKAAYARFLLRRPCVENQIADWLAAEAEVDAMLTFHPQTE